MLYFSSLWRGQDDDDDDDDARRVRINQVLQVIFIFYFSYKIFINDIQYCSL